MISTYMYMYIHDYDMYIQYINIWKLYIHVYAVYMHVCTLYIHVHVPDISYTTSPRWTQEQLKKVIANNNLLRCKTLHSILRT